MTEWAKEIRMAITVCDKKGTIVYMNEQSKKTFQSPDQPCLLGTSLWECHPKNARDKIHELMETGNNNVYTIEKNGKKKIIYQTPWLENNQVAGLVECSFDIPIDMPHFIRETLIK